jgi:hypothetical protein
MFNTDSEDVLKLKGYCGDVLNNLRPFEEQPHQREGIFLFCEDWEIVELLKRMFNGHDTYMKESPPRRLKFNPLWSQEAIDVKGQQLIDELKTADAIIEHFKKMRGR